MSSINGAGGIRTDLIKKFRKEINNKTYRVKSDEIATKMAKDFFNLKSSLTRFSTKA